MGQLHQGHLLMEIQQNIWFGEIQLKNGKRKFKFTKKNIDVIGCAQFDIYKQNPKSLEKNIEKNWCKKNELVCYAGSNIGINETKHLKILDKQISLNKLKVKILYRPHLGKI